MNIKIPQVLLSYADELTAYYQPIDPKLARFVGPCFLNTIETTVQPLSDGRYFVITGDIPAMWLRDSAAQLRNYIPFARTDTETQTILRGAIRTMVDNVLIDPYANAFNDAPNGKGAKDITVLSPWVWERKYETDSLCSPVLFIWQYWKESGDAAIFSDNLKQMLLRIFDVFACEQDHTNSPYSFERHDCPPCDTLSNQGRGTPVARTGMTWSGFRPSDDACQYGYLIPANMMAAVALEHAAEMLGVIYKDKEAAQNCHLLRSQILEGIERHAVVTNPALGQEMYAYETDGLGHYNLMDDANVPSLLSMPYFGYCSSQDYLYQNTRRFILSEQNPYYHTGKFASGIGSPHTPAGSVWPIAIIMQALTSNEEAEIRQCLEYIKQTDAGTGLIHESFDPSAPSVYSRSWFAWANSLFATLLIKLMQQGFFH